LKALLSILVLTATASLTACDSGTSEAETLALPEGARQASWSPDGGRIAVPAHDKIELIRADGSLERRITIPGVDISGFSCECRIGWSENGERLHVVTQPQPRDAKAGVTTVTADGASPLRKAFLGVPVRGASWSPHGWPLVFVPNSIVIRGRKPRGPTPDLWRLDRLSAQPRKVISLAGEELDPVFSPDGSEILFSRSTETRSSLWAVSLDGSRLRQLAGGLSNLSAAWSPDGSRVAFTANRRGGDLRTHLYIVTADGGEVRQLAGEEVRRGQPAWTPDGRWIAFANYEGEIRRVRPNGSAEETILSLPDEDVSGLSWSPNGVTLAYSATPRVTVD